MSIWSLQQNSSILGINLTADSWKLWRLRLTSINILTAPQGEQTLDHCNMPFKKNATEQNRVQVEWQSCWCQSMHGPSDTSGQEMVRPIRGHSLRYMTFQDTTVNVTNDINWTVVTLKIQVITSNTEGFLLLHHQERLPGIKSGALRYLKDLFTRCCNNTARKIDAGETSEIWNLRGFWGSTEGRDVFVWQLSSNINNLSAESLTLPLNYRYLCCPNCCCWALTVTKLSNKSTGSKSGSH